METVNKWIPHNYWLKLTSMRSEKSNSKLQETNSHPHGLWLSPKEGYSRLCTPINLLSYPQLRRGGGGVGEFGILRVKSLDFYEVRREWVVSWRRFRYKTFISTMYSPVYRQLNCCSSCCFKYLFIYSHHHSKSNPPPPPQEYSDLSRVKLLRNVTPQFCQSTKVICGWVYIFRNLLGKASSCSRTIVTSAPIWPEV